ncbi:argininosuccinate synthase [Saccharothrix sp. 6-C]|uniref:argininosuccinate synthase domain-containing protein n=1 Tax=Saccharothrix sp. 6-C TaxID=2781735 RepID=UPI0019174570|nr:argininosuccinate synthase domain-containing protein [Saccharothrix sp. 6-C]QQQ74739.1 argininosuccinate synthase [Saccharothrix sp. 6-C]
MSERVVLVCPGGATSAVGIHRLAEETGAGVVAVAVDLDRGEDPEAFRQRALAGGAVRAEVVDARDEFADRYCLPALRANALRPASALYPPLVAEHLVGAAARHGATAVAHGCAGHDGVRLEAGIRALAPDLRVLALVHDHVPHPADRTPPVDPVDPDELVITFDRGRPVAIDGETVTMLQAVQELNRRAGARGSGRGARVHETPGAVALTTAHRGLEDATLEPDLARFKRRVERRWGELVRDGLWFSPLKRALDSFIDDTQPHVSGEVRLVLHGGRAVVADRRGEPPLPDFSQGPASPRGLPTKIAAKRDSIT